MAGDIVAKLGIDGSQWSSGLGKARGEMSAFVGGAARAFAPLGAAIAGAFGAKESVSAFQESLTNARKLSSVLAATGGAAGLTAGEIADYASQLQKVTNFEDDATVAAAAMLASFTNIRGDTFKGAIAGAMDMSAVLGTDLTSNLQLLGKALNDPMDGLTKLGRAGIQFSEAQHQQITALQESGQLLEAQGIILDTVASKFGGAAEATAEPMTQLSNTIGDVSENIGALMLPALTVGAEALTEFLGVVVGGADSFKELGIEAAVQLSHIGGLVKLAALDWSIALVEWVPGGEQAWQTLGTTIYATLEGSKAAANVFVENFIAGLIELKNVGEATFESIMAGATSIVTGGLGAKSMGEVFNETLAKQKGPEVTKGVAASFSDAFNKAKADSQKGFEDGGGALKGLKGERDQLANTLGESMQKQRAELTAKFDPNRKVPVAQMPELIDFSKPKKEKDAKDKSAPKEKASPSVKTDVSAALLGSSEAASLLTRGMNNSPALAVANRQLAEQKRTTDAIKQAKPKGQREKVLFFEDLKPQLPNNANNDQKNKNENAQLAELKKIVAAVSRPPSPMMIANV